MPGEENGICCWGNSDFAFGEFSKIYTNIVVVFSRICSACNDEYKTERQLAAMCLLYSGMSCLPTADISSCLWLIPSDTQVNVLLHVPPIASYSGSLDRQLGARISTSFCHQPSYLAFVCLCACVNTCVRECICVHLYMYVEEHMKWRTLNMESVVYIFSRLPQLLCLSSGILGEPEQ